LVSGGKFDRGRDGYRKSHFEINPDGELKCMAGTSVSRSFFICRLTLPRRTPLFDFAQSEQAGPLKASRA
jgi:hypothetical protein